MPLRARSRYPRSERLFTAASRILSGGVNSPVRAFKSVGATPIFIERGRGAQIEDADGHKYVDYVMSWGPLIHGHAPKGLVKALAQAAARGTSFGAPTELETRLAQRVAMLMPSMERVRFVSSGTEAAMSAVRVARAATRRDRIIKFEGGYHGHADPFLAQAGSGALTLGVPTSPGVPAAAAADTLLATYNDIDSVKRLAAGHRGAIAALVVEPIAGNMGLVLPADGFLKDLRTLCDTEGIVLIFDEVISGFRASTGGAQKVFGVRPDLTVLGKIIGGGLPVGAYGGRTALMELVAPAGPVYQAGTLSGNPLAMTAGLWSLENLSARLQRHGEAHCRSGGRPRRRRPRRRRGAPGERFRIAAHPIFHRPPGPGLPVRADGRHRSLRRLPSRDARAWHLPAAVAVRGVVPVRGAHAAARRKNHRCGEGIHGWPRD